MKVTYLVQKRQEDGTTRLETASHNEWVGLIREKSGLPKAQRRFFIKECIQENGEIDCMYIEVPYEVYKQWNCEHIRSERNRKSSQDIQFFSLEDQRSLVEHYLTVVDWVIRDHIKLNPQVCGLDYSDVHQEGCVHLCRAAAAYTGEPASFGAYAQKVVRNGLIPYCPRSADEARTSPS